jgi:hypothetical protein
MRTIAARALEQMRGIFQEYAAIVMLVAWLD